ncbi:MAG: CAAX prenyl protease-related protein [archaeon]
MIQYIIPFLAYILPSFLIKDQYLSYSVRIGLTAILLLVFWKKYNISFKSLLFPALVGLGVFIVWILLPFGAESEQFVPAGYLLLLKIFGFIIVTPIIEELFTRDFLIRTTVAIQDSTSFEKSPIGMFSWPSFIVSVLFFGFAHNMIIAGIIAGILFNLVLYRTKSIGDCITSHAVANALVAAYVLFNGAWALW